MKRTAQLSIFVGLVLLALGSPSLADAAAREIVKQALDALPRVSFQARLKLTNDDGLSRELDLRHKLVDNARSSYLEVTAPADLAGIRFLFLHRIDQAPLQYIKVTASRRSVLVSNEARTQPFLDSAYYVADVIEPELDAFSYRVVSEGVVQGRKCKFIEATPKDPAHQVYGKSVVAIDTTDHLVLQRDYYDRKGKLAKVVTVDAFEQIDGVWTIRKQTMKSLQEKRSSTIELTEIRYNVDIPDEVFKPEYLLR